MTITPKPSILSRLTQLGISPESSPTFAKRILLTNILGLLFSLNMSLSAAGFFYFGYYPLGWFTLFFGLSELCWPLCNHFKKYDASRIGMMVSSNVLGCLVSISLPSTGYHRGFLVMAGLPILLFSLREKKSIALGLLLPLFFYPFSQWAQFHIPSAYQIVIPAETVEFIHLSMGMIYVLLIFTMFYLLSRENDRSEKKMASALQDLEDQRAVAFASTRFAALGEMASGIVHEINNPMTAITLNVQQAKHQLNDEPIEKAKIQERLDKILRIADRVAQIIGSMRTISRDASQDPFQSEYIQTIIDETMDIAQDKFKKHGVRLMIDCRVDDLQINCRSVQISQVILNLLNNAFDAVEQLSERWVKLSCYKEQNHLIIQIRDAGTGINPLELDRIFKPFYTTKPVGRGTGLGLSLSLKIVEEHGGKLTYEAQEKETCFQIRLPVFDPTY